MNGKANNSDGRENMINPSNFDGSEFSGGESAKFNSLIAPNSPIALALPQNRHLDGGSSKDEKQTIVSRDLYSSERIKGS